jgi:CRISPR-associated protein Cmr4
MQTQARLITLQAITFLHLGTGQSTGVVDLPIQREVHTHYPMFASSGFKGSLRDKAEQLWGETSDDVKTLFGSSVGGKEEKEEKEKHAGCLSVTDARILAFPVRSLQQVFVWVTCPMVIERLLRDAELIGCQQPSVNLDDALTLLEANALIATDSPLQTSLILEELNFTVTNNAIVDAIVNLINPLLHTAGFDGKRLVIISNNDFQHLVRYATQISARIKLNDRKTTDGDGGNLWYEETLPPETLMYALALCHAPREKKNAQTAEQIAKKLETLLDDKFLQIGGNETVGQGWCCIKVNGGA